MFSDLNDQALKQSSKDTICPVLSSSNQIHVVCTWLHIICWKLLVS